MTTAVLCRNITCRTVRMFQGGTAAPQAAAPLSAVHLTVALLGAAPLTVAPLAAALSLPKVMACPALETLPAFLWTAEA